VSSVSVALRWPSCCDTHLTDFPLSRLNVANGLLGRVFLGHGSYLLSESRTLS
jgi:hypothetical protein